jgi:hypothetical protein
MYCKLILFYVKQLDQLMEKGLADEEMSIGTEDQLIKK